MCAVAYMEQERFLRQLDIVPFDVITQKSASVIGCGAIGRQLATQLAAIGIPKIQLIDHDTVCDHNRTTQGYRIKDLNRLKVEALAEYIAESYDDVELSCYPFKFPNKQIDNLNPIIFVCVDSIRARKDIWKVVSKNRPEFFIDCRMLAENMHVIALSKDEDFEFYETTLFADDEEQQGSCTARMTIYSASICAGLASHQFTRYLRQMKVNRYKNLSLPAQFYKDFTEPGFED